MAVPRVADEGILCTLAALTRDCSLLQMRGRCIQSLHAGRRCGSLDACPLAYSVRLGCTHHSWLQLKHCAACQNDSKQALLLEGSLAARNVKLSLQLRVCKVGCAGLGQTCISACSLCSAAEACTDVCTMSVVLARHFLDASVC